MRSVHVFPRHVALVGLRDFVRKMHHQNLTFSEERYVNGLNCIEGLFFLIGNSLGDSVFFICKCVIRELTVSPCMSIRTDSRKQLFFFFVNYGSVTHLGLSWTVTILLENVTLDSLCVRVCAFVYRHTWVRLKWLLPAPSPWPKARSWWLELWLDHCSRSSEPTGYLSFSTCTENAGKRIRYSQCCHCLTGLSLPNTISVLPDPSLLLQSISCPTLVSAWVPSSTSFRPVNVTRSKIRWHCSHPIAVCPPTLPCLFS